jgi:acetylornithine deacetylase
LQGGTEISVYAARCLLQMERRTVPGETVAQATAELQAIVAELAAQDATFKATVTPTFSREPFSIAEEADIVQIVDRAAHRHLGRKPDHIGQTFWTDAAIFAEAGFDTVLIGPTGHGLHSDEEWVELDSVLDLAHILADTAVRFCT